MQVSVKKVNNVEFELTISVPNEVIETNYQKQINQLAKKAVIKGFRRGKVPISYIKQHFGGEARRDALEEIIRTSLYEAIQREKLRPINAPRIEPKSLETDKPLEFIAHLEVLPEISEVKFNLDKIQKLTVEITEADIERSMGLLIKQHADWQTVERPAKEKDRLVVDYHVVQEGEIVADSEVKDSFVELGSATMIPGFEQGLIGKKADEVVELHLTYPEDFHDKEKAGKPIHLVVTIKRVIEAILPQLDQEFLEKMGIASSKKEDLQAQIRQTLDQDIQRLIREKIKEQVFDQLLTENPIEVPPSLIAREAKNVHDAAYPATSKHDHDTHDPSELAMFNEVAKKRVIIGLLIAALAKNKNIKLDNDRLHKRIEEIASSYEQPDKVINWLLNSDERKQNIELQILEEQVIDQLLEGIPEEIKTISYAELKGISS